MNLFVRLRRVEALFEVTGSPGNGLSRVEALVEMIETTAKAAGGEVPFRWTGQSSGAVRVYFRGERTSIVGCVASNAVLLFDVRVTFEKDEKEVEEEKWELSESGWRRKNGGRRENDGRSGRDTSGSPGP